MKRAPFQDEIDKLIEELIFWGIEDRRILRAFREVPRHKFVLKELQKEAYNNHPLPIGYGATISQPYIVALMTEFLNIKANHRILEVGTGSGYQSAILSKLASNVYSIENEKHLASKAARKLELLKYSNVVVKKGDGYYGWEEFSPFDGIIVTAATPRIPEPLVAQLKVGGRLVLPVGKGIQELQVVHKTPQKVKIENTVPVVFIPMTGAVWNR